MTRFYFVISYLGLSSWKFSGGEIPTLIRLSEIIRDLQRAQMLAMLCAIDSRSRDCGNDGVWLWCEQTLAMLCAIDSRSRDCGNDEVWLWCEQTLAILYAVDSRSRDCGNDGVWLWCEQTLAILYAVDSRSRDCGNDGFDYNVCQRQQFHAL
jgi:hypothetical protein